MHSQVRLTAVLLIAAVAGPTVGRSGVRAAEEPRVIAITAKRFEFSPKEVTLTLGETVKLQLTTEDVTHGFFMKPLGIDEEIVPGKTTEVVVTPQTPGRYTTICDHFCGAGHGSMKMTIVVAPEARAAPDDAAVSGNRSVAGARMDAGAGAPREGSGSAVPEEGRDRGRRRPGRGPRAARAALRRGPPPPRTPR
jgi:cytochrome c oxidase subunit 2